MEGFTGVYPVSKTLRFSLLPQGATRENIAKSTLLATDSKRAKDYKAVKKIIDKYHKDFIARVLSSAHFDWSEMAYATEAYQKIRATTQSW